MSTKVTLDKSGRIVIPKALRDQLQLRPGDTFQLDSEGERITLRPVRPQASLKKEHGVWVYQGETTDASISDLIDRERWGGRPRPRRTPQVRLCHPTRN